MSITGVKNLEGMDGAETFNNPGFTAAALNLGDCVLLGDVIIGPDTLPVRSKQDWLTSYFPGPTSADSFSRLRLPTRLI